MTREELIAANHQGRIAKGLIETNYQGAVYSVQEAAEIMHCSRQAVYARAAAGDLELVHTSQGLNYQGRAYITARSLDAFISEGKGAKYDKHRPKCYKGQP